jgi:hypothetical protein
MAELPRLAAGSHVPSLFSWSQAASANLKAVFLGRVLGNILATPGCVDVGEKEGGRL